MLKRIVIVACSLLIILVVAAVAVAILFDPNKYKNQISAYASGMAGREVHIVDDMKLTFYPWLGVSFGRVTVANAPGFAAEPLAQVNKARVDVRLIPLLSRHLEFGTIAVDGLEINLERNRSGRGNWEGMGPATERPSAPAAAAAPALALPAALSIGGLDIRRAAVHWRDDGTGTALDVSDVAIQSGRLEPGRPIDLRVSFDFNDRAAGIAGRAETSARLTVQTEKRFSIEPFEANVQLSGAKPAAAPLAAAVRAKVLADLDRETVEFFDVALDAAGIQIKGETRIEHLTAAPRVNGRAEIAAFNPRAVLKKLGREDIHTADPKALSTAALSARFDFAGDRLRFDAVDARLDDSRLRGTLAITQLAKPAFAFDLAVDKLDADRYLPPSATPTPGAFPAAPAAVSTLPVETLRALALDGTVKIDALKITGLSLRDVRGEIRARDGVLAFAPLSATLYGGRYAGSVRLDARGDAPAIGLEANLSDIQAEPLLKDMLDIDVFSGIANVRAALSARGSTESEWRRSLSGSAGIGLRNGAIKGFNAAQMIRDVKARLEGGSAAIAVPHETDFAELSATVNVAGGVARNDDLRASSPYLRLGGSGEADLVREEIDYRLRARIVDTSRGQGGAGLEDVKGIDIPIRISGALAKPEIGIDADAVARLLRDRLTKELEGKAREQLQKKLKDVLKGLQ
jgi:AsmA protein